MPRVWKSTAAAVACAAAIGLVLLAADRAGAQAEETIAPPTVGAPAPADTALAAATPDRLKHPRPLGVSVRYGRRVPVHILKESVRNINDITAPGHGLDAGLRWYALDGMALSLRYARGGLNLTDNAEDLARFPNLTGDEYLKLDSYTFAVAAYMGGAFMPDSRWNPYLLFSASKYEWAFTHGGRDGDPYLILDTPIEGNDIGVAGGIGAEYTLGAGFLLEAEWSWNYIFTEMDQTSEDFQIWTNTHYWNLGLGLVWTF